MFEFMYFKLGFVESPFNIDRDIVGHAEEIRCGCGRILLLRCGCAVI